MAIVKHRAIHTTPRAHLKYIMNPHKNEEMKYCSAICCTNEYEAACEDFREIYEAFSEDTFDNYDNSKKKNHVRIHSYIQSFDETVSPELAHKIGVEWAKKMFGEDRPIIVSTHTNTGHVHNHIAVCPFDTKGNRWLANKESLKLARSVSDRICRSNGLSVINDPQNKGRTYAEWLNKRNDTSWKDEMADKIDELICSPDVTDIETLIEKMKEAGYIFTNEERLIAKPQKAKHGYTIAKLGYGYSREALLWRITQKQIEINFSVSDNYRGLQVEAAFCFREVQRELYRSDNSEIRLVTDAELKRNADLLCFISNKNIRSKEEFANLVNESAELVKYAEEDLELLKYQNAPPEEIEKREQHIEKLKERKTEYGRNYRTLLGVLETDYDRILKKEKLKKQMEEYNEQVRDKPERTNPREFTEQICRMAWWSGKVKREIEKQREQERIEQEKIQRQRNSSRSNNYWAI